VNADENQKFLNRNSEGRIGAHVETFKYWEGKKISAKFSVNESYIENTMWLFW